MKTFKITTVEVVEVEKEIEVTFPHFRKKSESGLFYKVVNKDKCLRVAAWKTRPSIEVQEPNTAFSKGSEEISANEFLEVFLKANAELIELAQ